MSGTAAPGGPQDGDGSESFHMTPEEFRRRGTELVGWIADYMETIEDRPVQSRSAPGSVRDALGAAPPAGPEPFDAVMADVERAIMPGLTHWQSPGFFGFFPANSSGPSVLGELLSAGLGVQGMSWATSPAATELETLVMDWLVELLALPSSFLSTGAGGGVIQPSASDATLCALLAARHRTGVSGDLSALRAYSSVEAHSSVEKAVRIAGLDPSQLRAVPTDERQAMRVESLTEAMATDRADGLIPFFVVATAGTTSSMAFDPVPDVAEVCGRFEAWLHVDAAMAGSAAVDPALRWVNDGVDGADSYCFNPHKWLFTNFDCDAFWVTDRSALLGALSVLPEYLRNAASESGSVIDYRDWNVSLGRRFRALKLWFVLRHYGARGLRHHVARHVELAQGLAARVEADDRFLLATPCALNLVCLRHVGGDEPTERILAEVNRRGDQFLTYTRIDDHYVIRVCVGQTHTDARHVDALWAAIDALA